MTITLNTCSMVGRARHAMPHATGQTGAPVRHTALDASPTAAPLPIIVTTNPWRDGKGFGSEYTAKRIHPGRLEGVT